jgi:serine/threonine protein kinase
MKCSQVAKKKPNQILIPSVVFEDASYDFVRVVDASLGRGTFGQVFQVFVPFLNAKVAVKVTDLSNNVAVNMLKDEVELLGSCRHPHIADIYGSGTYQGTKYAAMMPVYWGDTAKLIGTYFGLLPTSKIMNILAQVLSTIMYLQEKNVSHNDIKPG